MIDWSSHRGKLVTPEMLRELNRMSRRLEEIDRSHLELRDALRRKIEEDVSTEVIPVEITGTEVRDGVEVHAWREITTDDAAQDGGRSSDGYDENDDPDEFAFGAKGLRKPELFVLRHQVAIDEGGSPLHEERYSLLAPGRSFWGEVKSATPIGGTVAAAKWKYLLDEVRRDDPDDVSFEAVPGGLEDVEAYNSLEAANTNTEGYGMTLETSGGVFYAQCTDEQLEFGHVPVGSVHRVWAETILDGSGDPVTVWTFSAPNPVDGCVECPEEAAGEPEE
jgi:hypothetical protein